LKPASAKAKGRKLQKWVRDLLVSLDESLTVDDVRSASMGAGGEDIPMSSAARAIFPVSIECKNSEKLQIWSAYEQAKANAGEHEPVVVFAKNRTIPMVAVNAEFFFNLLKSVK